MRSIVFPTDILYNSKWDYPDLSSHSPILKRERLVEGYGVV